MGTAAECAKQPAGGQPSLPIPQPVGPISNHFGVAGVTTLLIKLLTPAAECLPLKCCNSLAELTIALESRFKRHSKPCNRLLMAILPASFVGQERIAQPAPIASSQRPSDVVMEAHL